MKKVLALVVAVALVFTTMTCCFVTSAAATGITLAADSVTVDSASAADVTVAGTLAAEADFVAILTITIKEGFTFNGIDGLDPYDAEAEAAAEEAGEDYDFDYIKDVVDGVTTIKSLKVYENAFTYAINVTAPANDTCAAVTYEDVVVVDAEYAAWDDDVVSTASAEADVTVNGKEHDFATVEKDADNHWTVCACGEATAPEAHTWNEGVVTTEPTVDAEGVKTYTCTFEGCGATKTEAIDKLEPPHVCDFATVEKDADNHWTVCECGKTTAPEAHTWNEGVVTTEPTVDAEGVKTYTCTFEGCGATKTEAIDKLEPAGPAVDSSLVAAGAGVGFATSSLQINFRVRKTVIQKYAKVDLIIVPDKYDAQYNLVADPKEIVADLTLNGNFYTFAYTDMALYGLGLNIKYFFRAYDANGELVAVSEDFNITPAGQLKTLYAQSSNNPEMLTMITDVLIVGSEAVNMYAKQNPDSDLAKAPSIIEGFDTSKATAEIPECNTVDSFTSYDSNFGNASTATYYAAKSAAIGTAPYLNLRIKDKGALDVNKFSVRISYSTQSLSGPITSYDKTFTEGFAKSGQFVTFAFKEVSFCDSDKDILIEVMYDGTKVYDITYSIESYLSANTGNASIGGTATALLKLGASARALSAKNAAAN